LRRRREYEIRLMCEHEFFPYASNHFLRDISRLLIVYVLDAYWKRVGVSLTDALRVLPSRQPRDLGECFCDVTEWPQARWFKYMFWQIQLTNSTLTLASLCKLPFNKDGIFITRKNTELLSLKFVTVVKKYAWADFLWLSHFAFNIFFLRSWLTIT